MARPRAFDTAEQMEEAIEAYFSKSTRPTITGLALHLGFESRQSLYDYEQNEVFSYTIKRCRLRIENEYEQKLYEQGCSGAIFALKNFGWKDKTEQDLKVEGGVSIVFKKANAV